MPACNFSIPFSGSPAEIHQKAQAAIHAQGGIFHKGESSGVFELTVLGSTVAGSYNISNQELVVTIESKPFMIPCSTIRSYLAKHLETVLS
jgi:methyl coenzyme M reductase beta subunit